MLTIVTVIKARNIAKYIAYSSFTGLQYNRDIITSCRSVITTFCKEGDVVVFRTLVFGASMYDVTVHESRDRLE